MPRDVNDAVLAFDGRERTYNLHLPAGYAKEPTPLVLNFHGFGSAAWQQEQLSLITDVADDQGFAVVHPTGTVQGPNGELAWNSSDLFDVDDASVSTLKDRSVQDLLAAGPITLARDSRQPLDATRQLDDRLRLLQAVVDEGYLASLTLRELTS